MSGITPDSSNIEGGVFNFIPDGSTIPDETWRSRHKYFVAVVLVHIPILLGIGLFDGTESLVTGATLPVIPLWMLLIELGIIAGLGLAATIPRLDRRIRTVLAVTALAFCSGTLVHVTGGYIEAHFHFFVAIGIAAIYEDWLPFGIGIGYVVITHGLFGTLDPSRVYNHAAAQTNPWVWGVIHGVFVALLAVALTVHLSSVERSRLQAQSELERARERANRIDDLQEKQAEIERQRAEAERLKTEAERQREAVEDRNADLEAKAGEYRRAMDQAADCDLTVRVDPESESEAMTAIGESFNGMVRDLETTVDEIQSFAEAVQTRAQGIDESTRQAATASDEASRSVQDIATGTDEQRQMLTDVSGELSNFSATVEEVAASAQEVARTSEQTTAVATEGKELSDEMIEDAERVQASIETAVETVADLQSQMDTIAEISDVIADIADQTNMLALNASIEAARATSSAGSGEGFDVVASEVKQLAEETQESAGDIGTQIEQTQAKTEEVVANVTEATELMEKEVDAVTQVAEAFDQVVQNAEDTDEGVREISDTTDSQASSSEEVVSMVDEVAEISKQSADQAESVSAAVEEQTASMSEVSGNVSTIADRAADLTDLLSAFSVEAGQRGDVPTPSGSPGAAGDR